MQASDLYEIFKQFPQVQTDTRKIKTGDIFFALKGDKFDGNQFAQTALEQGASYAIIDNKDFYKNDKTILVENSLQSLQALAHHHRRQLNIPVIAITGSNGKTTTKELVHVVLSTKYKTYTTEGNLNNHIGIPLTLLKIKPDAEIAVIEMGANHLNEIASYCIYTEPTHGLITNCGKAHLEGFGSEAGVRKAKGELYEYLQKNSGTAFINQSYDYLQEMAKDIKNQVKYGFENNGLSGEIVEHGGFLSAAISFDGEPIGTIKTKLVGSYNLPNVLTAAAIGLYFKIDFEIIKTAIENYTPSNSRSQLVNWKGNIVVLDAYNANPSSMKLAIENFATFPGGGRIVVIGAMAELGEGSMEEHKLIVDELKKHQWENVLLVGGDFLNITHPFLSFENYAAVKEWFLEKNFTQKSILVKGSRSTQMEKILEP